MIVTERFELNRLIRRSLRQRKEPFGYGLLGAATYFRTYSRIKSDGSQERWADTVTRCVEGALSIRKTHLLSNGLRWDEERWQNIGIQMADAIFNLRMLPPGRGLWAQGTEYVYERGSMALNNCAFSSISHLSADSAWVMDALMCGVGVGFDTHRAEIHLQAPREEKTVYVVPDTREGWCDSVRVLIASYEEGTNRVEFDYSKVRVAGEPIRGFGGTASGPGPLEELHRKLRTFADRRVEGTISSVRLIADVINSIAKCVVAGNVRRSALIALGRPDDTEFLNLKDYRLKENRERMDWKNGWGHTSNNSIVLERAEDFDYLPDVASRVGLGGEPGVFNLMNVQKYGRMGQKKNDLAIGINPCVGPETRVLTNEGYKPIVDLVGQNVPVWNGEEWSIVVPQITGRDQEMIRVSFSDGTSLETTPYHAYLVDGVGKVEAQHLGIGARMQKQTMPVVDFGAEQPDKRAYTQGVYAGDGFYNQEKYWNCVSLYGDKDVLLDGMIYEHKREEKAYDRVMVRIPIVGTKRKDFVPHGWSLKDRLAWLAGLADTDGTLLKDGGIQISSIDKQFLGETRLMLTTLGVQARVAPMKEAEFKRMPDGRGGTKEYHCAASYRLLIAASDVVTLRENGLQTRRLDLSTVNPQRAAKRFVTVTKIESVGTEEIVYCFTETKKGQGTFEGIVTGQCGEIPLEDKELCNLVEVFPTRCKTEKDFLEAIELATIYASSVSLLRTHSEDTNAVIAKNRRIGVSISGIPDWMARVERKSDIVRLLNTGYDLVEATNLRLALEAGVPASVRLTTVKPSGSISLLAGVSPGMHHPIFQTYIRRVRVGVHAPIVEHLIQAGVPHEPAENDENGTLIFEFPIHMKGIRSQDQVSLSEHGLRLVLISRFWADNAASNTSNFRGSLYEDDKGTPVPYDAENPKRKLVAKGEEEEIETWLSYVIPHVKSSSMLPYYNGSQTHKQMPYESISYETFEKRAAAIKEIDWSKFTGSDGEDSRYCEGENCEV